MGSWVHLFHLTCTSSRALSESLTHTCLFGARRGFRSLVHFECPWHVRCAVCLTHFCIFPPIQGYQRHARKERHEENMLGHRWTCILLSSVIFCNWTSVVSQRVKTQLVDQAALVTRTTKFLSNSNGSKGFYSAFELIRFSFHFLSKQHNIRGTAHTVARL